MTKDKDETTLVKNFRNVQDVGDRTITLYTSVDSSASSIFGISTVFAFALLQLFWKFIWQFYKIKKIEFLISIFLFYS